MTCYIYDTILYTLSEVERSVILQWSLKHCIQQEARISRRPSSAPTSASLDVQVLCDAFAARTRARALVVKRFSIVAAIVCILFCST
jgi:hypothetical protein